MSILSIYDVKWSGNVIAYERISRLAGVDLGETRVRPRKLLSPGNSAKRTL